MKTVFIEDKSDSLFYSAISETATTGVNFEGVSRVEEQN